MFSFILVLLVTIAASFLPEKNLQPAKPKLQRNTKILQSFLVTQVFLVLTLIVQRPVFSGLAILVFLIILVAVSNAKFKALREPMVFSDFAMFAQAFKHPRLYFPFLGLAPVIVAPLLIIGLIILVLSLEPAMTFTFSRLFITLIAIIALYYISEKEALKLKLANQPIQDNRKYGLQNSLFAYFLYAKSDEHTEAIYQTLESAPFLFKSDKFDDYSSEKSQKYTPPLFALFKDSKPNITVIQSESFFDARRLHPAIKQKVLENYDAACAESIQYGKLKVPAWGANTMRSEFAFLTGIEYPDLGFYRYYPYQFMHEFPLTSIASTLQDLGYYCICIHPHHASFFGRDRIFPKMGFDEFIDIGSFEGDENFGPYTADKAVTDKILELTEQLDKKPLFIFAITMENHGPLHLEKATFKEHQDFYSDPLAKGLPTNLNDLSVYLRHLKNADQMIKTLTNAYKKSDRETTFCFYGDHVPSMPKVYEDTEYEDGDSDYFVWHSNGNNTRKKEALAIEKLASRTLLARTQSRRGTTD